VGAMLSDPEVVPHYSEEVVRAGADPCIERQVGLYRRDGRELWLASLDVIQAAAGVRGPGYHAREGRGESGPVERARAAASRCRQSGE